MKNYFQESLYLIRKPPVITMENITEKIMRMPAEKKVAAIMIITVQINIYSPWDLKPVGCFWENSFNTLRFGECRTAVKNSRPFFFKE